MQTRNWGKKAKSYGLGSVLVGPGKEIAVGRFVGPSGFRDTGCCACNSRSNPGPYILMRVGQLKG